MRPITIQGVTFEVDDKYSTGHVCNENEAGTLNQTRAENLRNNFAPTVKATKEEGAKAAGVEVDNYELTDDEVETLKTKFAAVAEAYEFGARGGGIRTTDPVTREARRIARDRVESAIREKHGRLSAVAAERITELVNELAAREDIRSMAQANVDAAKGVALELDI